MTTTTETYYDEEIAFSYVYANEKNTVLNSYFLSLLTSSDFT